MHTLRSAILLLATGLLPACAAPMMMAAHSLDRGQVSTGVGVENSASWVRGDFYAARRSEPTHGRYTIAGPNGLEDGNLDLQVGLGRGWEGHARLGWMVHSAGLKWSIRDERRERVEWSMALSLETQPAAQLLASRTQPMGQMWSLRPMAGLGFGSAQYTYFSALPNSFRTQRSILRGVAWFETWGHGVILPMGIEVPIRATENGAIVPYVQYVSWVPVTHSLEDAGCQRCNAGVDDLWLPHGSFLWLGVRWDRWMRPKRYSP